MPSFALAAIGRDRPGIVAELSKVLFERGCNLEDSSMSLLRGNFAVMLVLAAPDGLSAQDLQAALEPVCARLGLLYDVLEVDDRAVVPAPTHHLSVYGADRAGILYRITSELAARAVNVCDLSARLAGPEDQPVYAVLLDVAVPDDCDVAGLQARLQAVAAEIGVDVTMRELEDDVL